MKWQVDPIEGCYTAQVGHITAEIDMRYPFIRILVLTLYYESCCNDPDRNYPAYTENVLYEEWISKDTPLDIAKLQAKTALRLILQGIEFELNSSAE